MVDNENRRNSEETPEKRYAKAAKVEGNDAQLALGIGRIAAKYADLTAPTYPRMGLKDRDLASDLLLTDREKAEKTRREATTQALRGVLTDLGQGELVKAIDQENLGTFLRLHKMNTARENIDPAGMKWPYTSLIDDSKLTDPLRDYGFDIRDPFGKRQKEAEAKNTAFPTGYSQIDEERRKQKELFRKDYKIGMNGEDNVDPITGKKLVR